MLLRSTYFLNLLLVLSLVSIGVFGQGISCEGKQAVKMHKEEAYQATEASFQKGTKLKYSSPQESIKYFEQAYCLSEIHEDASWKVIALIELARIHLRLDHFQLSLELAREARKVNETSDLTRPDFAFSALSVLGKCHMNLNMLPEAIDYLKQTLALQRNLDRETFNNHIQTSYYNIGKCYVDLGDYSHAADYLQKAILQYNGEELGFRTYLYSLILMARVSHYNDDSAKALLLLDQAAEACERSEQDLSSVHQWIHYFRGVVLQQNLVLHQAVEEFTKVIDLNADPSQTLHAKTKLRISELYRDNGQFDEAASLMESSLAHLEKIYGNQHRTTIITRSQLASLQADLGANDLAEQNFNRATEEWINLPVDSFQLHEEHLLALEAMGAFYFKKGLNNDQEEDLLEAQRIIHLATHWLEQIRSDFIHDESKRLLLARVIPILEMALEINHELISRGIIEEGAGFANMFNITERNKHALLQDELRETEALKFASIPDHLLQQEKEIRTAMAVARQSYFKSKNSQPEFAEAQLERLLDEQEELNALKTKLVDEYPDYYELRYQLPEVDFDKLQTKLLAEQGAIVEFFWGHSFVYILGLSGNKRYFTKLPQDGSIEALTSQFNQQLSDAEVFQGENKAEADSLLLTAGHQLYQVLLKETLDSLGTQDIKSLTIIPDGCLASLPFSALLSSNGSLPVHNYAGLDYLVKQYEISYAFALNTITDLSPEDNELSADNVFGGYAPSYQGIKNINVGKLSGALSEVQNAAKIMTGDAITGFQASESNFKRQAGEYQILQLAMHAQLDSKDPLYNSFLLFNNAESSNEDNDSLTIAELYQMKLKAKLAVLSACNSGSGAYRTGEGVISLSRAFAYAGCPSLVSSQWVLPDRASSEIITHFFRKLKTGARKSEALRSAQLAYLQDIQDPMYSHPYYWAGLMPIGNMEALQFANDTSDEQAALFFFGALILSFVGVRIFLQRRGSIA